MALLVILGTLGAIAPSVADEVEVLSGDAIKIGQNEWRIANIDAPRLDARCQAERQLARVAQAKLAELLAQGDMELAPTGERDENERRMARVQMNGEDIGEKMLAAKLAQAHGTARPLCPKDRTFDPDGRLMGGMR